VGLGVGPGECVAVAAVEDSTVASIATVASDTAPLALGDAEDDTRPPASGACAFTYVVPEAVEPTRTTEATPA
jgi:hypothetical protein